MVIMLLIVHTTLNIFGNTSAIYLIKVHVNGFLIFDFILSTRSINSCFSEFPSTRTANPAAVTSNYIAVDYGTMVMAICIAVV